MELKLEGLEKRYGKKLALDGFSYTFKQGICGILGANGAGKSTMMNLITDNVSRDRGQILFDGKDVLKLGNALSACTELFLLCILRQQNGSVLRYRSGECSFSKLLLCVLLSYNLW